MALTERYVTSGAGGSGDGSIGDPWDWAQMLTDAAAGDRVNVKDDGVYARVGAIDAFLNSGTIGSPIWIRGYKDNIGDGDQGRTVNGTGPLDVSNMPSVTYVGQRISTNVAYLILESLSIEHTNSLNGVTLAGNYNIVKGCNITSTGTGGTSTLLSTVGNSFLCLCCDIINIASNAVAGLVLGGNIKFQFAYGCRVKCVGGTAISSNRDTVIKCLVYDSATGVEFTSQYGQGAAIECTVQNCTVGISSADSVNNTHTAFAIMCHITDCTTGFVNFHIATNPVPMIRAFNRYRDNVSGDDDGGFGDWPDWNAVVTDTGAQATDFEDYASADFRLIDGAAGDGAGVLATDIGAHKAIDTGGGGLLVHPGMTGGIRG